MKKVIMLLIVFGLFSNLSFAQFNTGSKTAGGSVSWSKNSWDGEDGTSILTIAPSVGYFVMDNLAVNVILNMLSIEWDGGSDALTAYGAGVKFYEKNLYGGVSYNSMKWYGEDGSSSLLIEGGYLHGLNENVFLDIGLDYSKGLGDNKSSTITVGVGVASFF